VSFVDGLYFCFSLLWTIGMPLQLKPGFRKLGLMNGKTESAYVEAEIPHIKK
jgi:hypothetical protein